MTFNVGEKVVCVDDTHDARCVEFGIAPLTKGQVYVVREIKAPTGRFGLLLVGVLNDGDCGGEYCYRIERFRTLAEMKNMNTLHACSVRLCRVRSHSSYSV